MSTIQKPTKSYTTERDGSKSSSRAVAVWSAAVLLVFMPLTVCVIAVVGVLKESAVAAGIIGTLTGPMLTLGATSVGALFARNKGAPTEQPPGRTEVKLDLPGGQMNVRSTEGVPNGRPD